MRRSILLIAIIVAGCSWRPPRFADRPPVTEVHDDRPISIPGKRTFIEEFYEADVYVRRELVNGLDPRSYPDALDVSSFDEVAKSSWFRGLANEHHPLMDYRGVGPPEAPFTVIDEPAQSGTPDAMVIEDARGLRYELQPDLPEREGMRTGAAAAASRLMHALGYYTPSVFIIRAHTGERVAATRWPLDVDLGPTPITELRPDDPNDQLPHVDRRSLRALKLVTAWLGITKMRPRMLRDAFVGKNAQGHVRHYIVGLDGALGVEDYLRAVDFANDPDREDRNFFLRMFSLGLSPKPPGILPKTDWPSIGLFSPRLVVDDFSPSPPFEPIDRLQPGDLYWIAKRIAAVPLATIAQAVTAAEIDPGPVNWLFQTLHVRRAAVVAYGYDQTTPCELVTLERHKEHVDVVLADLSLQQRFVPPAQRSYELTFFDAEGNEIAPASTVQAKSSIVRLRLPKALADRDYSVMRVWGRRRGVALPRPLDIHFRPGPDGLSVIGMRH